MKLHCPNCHESLDFEQLKCCNNHRFKYEDGVLILLEEKFERILNPFLDKFTPVSKTENRNHLAPPDYEKLPFGKAVENNKEWRLRCYDLEIIVQLLQGRKRQRILEIGPFNGWLTHRLVKTGHQLTVIDYFIDEPIGLKTKKFYRQEWQAIQMDVRDLSIFREKFEVIILNRCLQFFENPVEYLKSVKNYLDEQGLLIISGMQLFKNPFRKIEQLQKMKQEFLHRYHFPVSFIPTKDYLDFNDKQRLESEGVKFYRYPQLKMANLRAVLQPKISGHYYGVYFA